MDILYNISKCAIILLLPFLFQIDSVIMASVKKSVLMKYLQCTLCMEDMQRSCILQCHHSFCVDCIQKYMAQTTDTQKMTCPICRKVTTLPDGDLTNLPPNFFMDNLKDLITKETDDDDVEMKVTGSGDHGDRELLICSLEDCQGEAVIYCTVDQEYLCQTCTDEHAVHRFNRTHQTITVEKANDKATTSTKSRHPCGRHPDQMLDMYCDKCEKIICNECCKTEHHDHHFTTLGPFVEPCEERLDTLLKRIDKLLKCVDLARQTSQQQVNKAQHHIVSLKTQVTSTFTQIREKLDQQEERLMSDIERAATRVDEVALSTQNEQQLAEVNLESLRFLGQSLLTGDVYDQMINLPSLEEAVEKRWKTEIPGVVWKDQSDQDETKIKMSDVDHLTLTETSHTTVFQCSEGESGIDKVTLLEADAVNVTDAECNKPDQPTSESGEVTRFDVDRCVAGICLYNNTIFLIKRGDGLYMYSTSGDLMKRHAVDGMKTSWDVTVMTQDDGDKLIITSESPRRLYYIRVQSAGDTCTLGKIRNKHLHYRPHGLCVNDNNNLVVADQTNKSLRVYNSSWDEINTIKLPSRVKPLYLSSDPSGGYIISAVGNRIIWIDGHGARQRRHKDTARGIALSDVRNVVRDSENRYLVADCDNNQLLLFSKDGGDVRCLAKDKIISPLSLFLDQQQDKLYVGTWRDHVVVYDYYKLLGENKPVKYSETKSVENGGIIYTTTKLGIKFI